MKILPDLLFAGLGVLVAAVALAMLLVHVRREAKVTLPSVPDHDEDTVETVMPTAEPTLFLRDAVPPRVPPPVPAQREAPTEAVPTVPVSVELPRPAGLDMAWLKGVRGIEGEYLLSRPVNVMGRSRDCDVVLAAPTISRRHCEIRWDGPGWQVRAMGRNGTFVETAAGTMAVDPDVSCPLDDGDVVRLGSSVALRLVMPRPVHPVSRLMLVAAGSSNIGDRSRNEDAFLATRTAAAVADGVGGRPAGAVASAICVEVLGEAGEDTELGDVVQQMNAEIRRRGAADPLTSGMASTVDAVRLVLLGGVNWLSGAHVGDGYTILQQVDGRPKWLTRPHTYAAALVDAGQLSASEGDTHPESSRLLRAIGLDETVRADVWQERARPGQRIVVFTDGLLAALGQKGVTDALRRARRHSPERACQEIVQRALRADGNRDNVTVVVADVVAEVLP